MLRWRRAVRGVRPPQGQLRSLSTAGPSSSVAFARAVQLHNEGLALLAGGQVALSEEKLQTAFDLLGAGASGGAKGAAAVRENASSLAFVWGSLRKFQNARTALERLRSSLLEGNNNSKTAVIEVDVRLASTLAELFDYEGAAAANARALGALEALPAAEQDGDAARLLWASALSNEGTITAKASERATPDERQAALEKAAGLFEAAFFKAVAAGGWAQNELADKVLGNAVRAITDAVAVAEGSVADRTELLAALHQRIEDAREKHFAPLIDGGARTAPDVAAQLDLKQRLAGWAGQRQGVCDPEGVLIAGLGDAQLAAFQKVAKM